MTALPFDTYRFSRRLIDAGFSDKQAEELIVGATDAADQLATKQDLAAMESRIVATVGKIIASATTLILAGIAIAVTLGAK